MFVIADKNNHDIKLCSISYPTAVYGAQFLNRMCDSTTAKLAGAKTRTFNNKEAAEAVRKEQLMPTTLESIEV